METMETMETYIEEIEYSAEGLRQLRAQLDRGSDLVVQKDFARKKLILDYPTVYVIYDRDNGKYSAYVGESRNIISRTGQHLTSDVKSESRIDVVDSIEDGRWGRFSRSGTTKMYVIGNSYFNKSLTLDMENRLILYLTAVESISDLKNRRTNPQGNYYTREFLDDVFSQIWRKLNRFNKELFPAEAIIRDSALFKASPFHELNNEQKNAKEKIISLSREAIKRKESGQLILVSGEAGSGKTVLLSSAFFDMYEGFSEGEQGYINAHIIVNHEEQLKVYEQIAKKLQVSSDKSQRVWKPSTFIKNTSPGKPVDLVVIDEAHLLLTQGNQGYSGNNQLWDILDRARVVVSVFDKSQILSTAQLWEDHNLQKIYDCAGERVIELKSQMRIDANEETVQWIREFVQESRISPIPSDEKYDLQIFDDPRELRRAILEKNSYFSEVESGLSRMLATYDWEYSSRRKNPNRKSGQWGVSISQYKDGGSEKIDFFMPWNREIEIEKSPRKRYVKELAWAEQGQTSDEIGSHFTIQGFDLNYAGVILGPSVKYEDGKVVIDPDASWDKKAKQRRTLEDGSKEKFGERLLRNQLNVLLTRGVRGLYIYAVDEGLRMKLLEAAGKE